jgi:tripartite ATP-independent transporter DctP family solute receptor
MPRLRTFSPSRVPRPTRAAAALALAAACACAAPLAAQAQSQVVKVGYGIAEEHPLGQGVNRFIQLVEQKTAGKLKLRGYPANTLGSETQMISAARGGTQEITIPSSAALVQVQKEFGLFDLPFLFADERQADAVLDGPIGRSLLDKLADKDLVGLCYWENGFRQVTTSKRAIAKADDIRGLKVRTMQSPVYLDTFNALGANAVPMPFTEVYVALEQKAIDAQENPIGIIHANKIFEVQKYLSLTRHAYAPYVVLAGRKFWDRLGAAERTAVTSACLEAGTYQRKLGRDMDARLLADLKSKGMVVNEVPAAEIERMKAQLQPVIAKYTAEIGPDLIARVNAQLGKPGAVKP